MPENPINPQNVRDVNQELGYLEDALLSIADRLSTSIKGALEDVRDEGKGVAEVLSGQVNKSIKDLAKGLNQTLTNTEKLYKGSLKVSDIQKQMADREIKRLSVMRNLRTLEQTGVLNQKEYNKAIYELNEAEKAHTALLKDQETLAKKINKNLGITGKLVKGISKIPILGDLIDSTEILEKVQKKAAEEGSNRWKTFGATIKAVGASLLKSLTDPLTIIGLLVKGFKALINLAGFFAKRSSDIGKSFLNMAGNVTQVRDNLQDMANAGIYLNFEEAMTHMTAINALTGTAVELTRDQVKEMQTLTNLYGLSEENAAKLFKTSTLMGQPFDEAAASLHQVTTELNAGEGQAISVNDVMDKFVAITGQARNNLAKNPKLLAQAAFEAAKLGMNLSDIQSAAESTLNFESSIQKEMEAELFLGKSLNLENLRKAALSGNVLEQAQELGKLVKENIGATKGNIFKQQKLADVLGISVEKMFEISDEAELQDKLAAQGIKGKITLEKYNKKALKRQAELTKSEGRSVSLAEAKLALSTTELQNLADATKESQVMSRAIESIKESFVTGLAKSKVLDKINEMMLSFLAGQGFDKVLTLTGKVAETIGRAAGTLGKFLKFAIDNPKTFFAGLAAAIGGVLLFSKRIPQLVTIVGAGKWGKSIQKLLTKKAAPKVATAVMKSTGAKVSGAAAQAAVKAGTATTTKTVAKKAGTKGIAKLGAKAVGKSLLKKIPIIGLLAGIGFGLQRAMDGDFAGAALELASGAASTIPGLGTAASVAIDAGLIGRDIHKATSGDTAADFISRPGQPIQKFRADDVIVGGTSLGGGGNGEVVSLLKELIYTIKQGGDVYMDGAKVGKSMVLATSKLG